MKAAERLVPALSRRSLSKFRRLIFGKVLRSESVKSSKISEKMRICTSDEQSGVLFVIKIAAAAYAEKAERTRRREALA